jgi:hypothetical protein
MRRTIRPHLIGALGALILLVVVPAALGAKPTRTVVASEPFVIPAGLGCAFDVLGEPEPDARQAITEFSDGRIQTIGHGSGTLTNAENGESFDVRSRYKETETPLGEGLVRFEISGRIFISFFPGDQGPFGEVEEPGLLLEVIGHQRITAEADTLVFTSYSLNGQATDICAQID